MIYVVQHQNTASAENYSLTFFQLLNAYFVWVNAFRMLMHSVKVFYYFKFTLELAVPSDKHTFSNVNFRANAIVIAGHISYALLAQH